MTDLKWQHATKDDGRPFLCFETFEVLLHGARIGSFQCVGSPGGRGCRGVMADPRHKHGPWIAGTGALMDKQEGIGTYDSQRGAAEAVRAAHEAKS